MLHWSTLSELSSLVQNDSINAPTESVSIWGRFLALSRGQQGFNPWLVVPALQGTAMGIWQPAQPADSEVPSGHTGHTVSTGLRAEPTANDHGVGDPRNRSLHHGQLKPFPGR